MAAKLPWFKWYADDWLSDEALRACSLAARGLWVDMLSLMHKCDRRGYLLLAGKPVTAEQLARMTGCSTDDASRLLTELLNSGVCSALDDGTIYSRRMVRDEARRQIGIATGKRGGNPALAKNPREGATLKGQSKGVSNGASNPPLNVASGLCISSSFLEREEEEKTHQEGVGGVGEGATLKGQSKGRAVDALDREFDAFWHLYPSKKAKMAARRAWDELDADAELVDEILAAVRRDLRSEQWQRGIVPHAVNWLKGQRWLDEETPAFAPGESIEDRIARARAERARAES